MQRRACRDSRRLRAVGYAAVAVTALTLGLAPRDGVAAGADDSLLPYTVHVLRSPVSWRLYGVYLGKGLTAIAQGLNLNNEVFGFYYGSAPYFTQREYYKPTYTFGLRWDLHHGR